MEKNLSSDLAGEMEGAIQHLLNLLSCSDISVTRNALQSPNTMVTNNAEMVNIIANGRHIWEHIFEALSHRNKTFQDLSVSLLYDLVKDFSDRAQKAVDAGCIRPLISYLINVNESYVNQRC